MFSVDYVAGHSSGSPLWVELVAMGLVGALGAYLVARLFVRGAVRHIRRVRRRVGGCRVGDRDLRGRRRGPRRGGHEGRLRAEEAPAAWPTAGGPGSVTRSRPPPSTTTARSDSAPSPGRTSEKAFRPMASGVSWSPTATTSDGSFSSRQERTPFLVTRLQQRGHRHRRARPLSRPAPPPGAPGA